MAKTLKVGIIGPGSIARNAHIPQYISDPRTEVTAVVSRTEETAREAAEIFGIPGVYTSVAQMLEKEQPDLVSVCTPNKFHQGAVIEALQAGCHVLCEKPPAINAAEALKMEMAARDNGRHLLYAFHHRYNPETAVLKRAVDSGDLGDIYHVNVQAMRRRGIPGWGVFTDRELQGGGPLIDVGVHMLDLAMYITGFQKPVEVMGTAHQRFGKKPGAGLLGEWDTDAFTVEDLAAGMIRFENGMSLMLETSFAANIRKDENLNVSFLGDKGGADINPLTIYEEKYGSLFNSSPAYLERLDSRSSYEMQIQHFIDVAEGKAAPVISPYEGTAVQQLVDALYESAERQQSVQL